MRKGLLILVGLFTATGIAVAATAPNPRGGGDVIRTTGTNGSTRGGGANVISAPASSSLQPRGTAINREVTTRTMPGIVSARSATSNSAVSARTARTATTAASTLGATVSRSGTARATAVFNDMTKMGTGYAGCYDTYNTCMDQFCAAANNNYRRCFCSDKFKEFRDTEAAISQAKTLLLSFSDNNLNVVDKTAEEVRAMYSATEGEKALKKDVSASSKMLAEIEDLLSGKKKATVYTTNIDLSSINFTDISSIWDNPNDWMATGGRNMSALDGIELYNESNRQCTNVTSTSCEGATAGMVRSAYSILIAQDCSTYERKVAADRETLQQTIRDAYKILREARLEDYRAHNSADMNECIAKVRNLILSEHVCGAGFKKCLDPSGLYINATTGEPIYSSRLFNLTSTITLADDGRDLVTSNAQFNRSLETKRKFAETALDTCRSIQEDVWYEFKRAAIIEIAQAQDEAIESVRSSCVSTMKECYDSQGNQLAAFDNTSAQATGAIIAKTTSAMCREKVQACAALFSDGTNPCVLDAIGNITNADRCGLTALWTFVDTVDTMKASEGCETALTNYIQDLCKPVGSSEYTYPYGCRLRTKDWLSQQLNTYAATHCIDPSSNKVMDKATQVIVPNLVSEVGELLSRQLQSLCTKYGGLWMTSADEIQSMINAGPTYTETTTSSNTVELENSFLYTVYNGAEGLRNAIGRDSISLTTTATGKPALTSVTDAGYGLCVLNTIATQCRLQDADTGGNGYVTFNSITGECEISEAWYKIKCEGTLFGTWNTSSKTCSYKPEED